MNLTRVTITGIDEQTNPGDLEELSREYPFVEWGILLSKNREGKEPRYPSQKQVERFLFGTRPGVNFAGHLCGSWARDLVNGPFIWAIRRPWQFQRFDRLQVNSINVVPSTLDKFDFLASETGQTFILQVPTFGLFTSGYVLPPKSSVDFLIDNSGGMGKPIMYFAPPPAGLRGGYSGGLGPDTIRGVLEILTGLPCRADFWIDMESRVRTDDDWLDLDKVRECLRIANEFVEK